MFAFRVQEIALGWQILETTDSALWLGAVSFAYGLPLLLLSPLAGLLADRWRRQNVVISSQVVAATATGMLAILARTHQVTPLAVVAVSFLLGCMFALFSPARMALLPNLVPNWQLENAAAMEYSSTRLLGFFGPVLAGFLFSALGFGPVLLVQMALFLSAAVIFMFTGVNVGRPETIQHYGHASGLGDTWALLQANRQVLGVLLLGLFVIPFGMTYVRLMQVFVRDILSVGPAFLGLALGLAGLGSAASGLVITMMGHTQRRGLAVVLSAIGFGFGLILLSFMRDAGWVLMVMLVVGVVSGVYLTLSNVIIQAESPDRIRGRVLSLWGMIWGMVPIMVLISSAFAEQLNVALVIGACGLICVVSSIALLTSRSKVLEF
jgi:MFS family permease